MKSIDQIEHLLKQTPTPCVVEGPHREQLKQRLLEQSQTALPRRERMKISVFGRMPSLMKLAAALLVAALLIGTGWAAEKIYKMVTSESTVILHKEPSGAASEFETSAPNPAEWEKQVNEEIKQLVAKKKYKFIRAIDLPQGGKVNVYYFQLSNGTRLAWKRPPPRLEDVASLDDYERKSEEYAAQRQKDIEKAVAGGKGRLVNIIVTEIHVCRDVESNQKLDVRRVTPRYRGEGNDDFAEVYPGGMQEYEKPGDHVFRTSSWRDHLKAIQDGKRELLDIRLVKQGIYETVREDGSKLVFPRELPLQEKPERK